MRLPDWTNQLSTNLHQQQIHRSAVEGSGITERPNRPHESSFNTMYQSEIKDRYTSSQKASPGPVRQESLQAFSRTWDLNLMKAMSGRGSSAAPAGKKEEAPSPGGNDIPDVTGLSGESIIDRFKKSSNFSYEHSMRVGEMAGKLAQKLNPSLEGGKDPAGTMEAYYTDLGKFHDIGKYSIPFEILEKPGKLTPDELNVVKSHPVIGETMLRQNSEFSNLLPAVRHHHERWDGTGYPDGLKGEDIPLEARIISVVDSYDAIISDRPYRKGTTPAKALDELKRCAGSQFDPRIVTMFSDMMSEMK